MIHKILVVDDEESIRLILPQVFSDYSVLTAMDGKTALRLIETEHPSVVLLDINMPSMSGLAVLVSLKAMPNPPLVFMLTGDEDLDTAIKALEMGAHGYITKPFEFKQLKDIVVSALDELEKNKEVPDKPWRIKKKGKG